MSFFTVEGKPILKPILIGIVVAVLVTVILTAILAFTVLMMPSIPYGWIDYILIGIEGFGILLGTFIACAVFKSKGLLIGAICAGIMILMSISVGMSFTDSSVGLLTLIRCIALMICGIAGGIAGVNRKEKIRIK